MGTAGAGSQKNKSVLLTAPGAGAKSAYFIYGNNEYIYGYSTQNGTSCAAPVVTGAIAVIMEAAQKQGKILTPEQIRKILEESATDDAKGDGYDTAYGHGILNVAAAIELAEGREMLAPENVTYRVTAEEKALSDAVTVADYVIGHIGSHPLGEIFMAEAEPTVITDDGTYKFAYWANGNGTYVSGETPYTFTATSNFTLCAVYDKVPANGDGETQKKVEFWNGNGIWLGTKTANKEGKVASAHIPETEAKMTGYVFDSWIDDEEGIFSAETVLKKNFTRVVAQFKDTTAEYSITFDDNVGTDTTETGVYGTKVGYTVSDEADFDYWTLDGKIVSYNPSVEIALWGEDKKLTAVYNDDTAVAKPTVVLDTGADGADFLIYAVPGGYKISDAGIVFGTEGSTPRVASFHSKASVKKIPDDGFGQFTSLPGDASHTVARGYLIYKDTSGVIRVIYAEK